MTEQIRREDESMTGEDYAEVMGVDDPAVTGEAHTHHISARTSHIAANHVSLLLEQGENPEAYFSQLRNNVDPRTFAGEESLVAVSLAERAAFLISMIEASEPGGLALGVREPMIDALRRDA